MRRVIAACFWVCLACAVAGAAVGISLVWGLATDYEVSEIRKTIAIVFVAAAVTLVVGRVSLGRSQSAERGAVADGGA
jgi:ABC-type uncharacterized transport system permease subunit